MYLVHGDSTKKGEHNRIYNIWRHIKRRCNCPEEPFYQYYGGKGIKLCSEWSSYPKFKEWSLASGYGTELEIDRIDSNKDYEPSNCRWTTELVQQNNRTNNLYLEFNGQRMTVADLARLTGKNRKTLQDRYHQFQGNVVKMLDYEDRPWRWRKNLLESMVGTRKEQYKKDALLGEKGNSPSTGAADLKSKIDKLTIDISGD